MGKKGETEFSKLQPELGKKLRLAREANHYSLSKVAKLAGMSSSALASVERGENVPSAEHLFKVCRIYDLTMDDVMPGETASTSDVGIAKFVFMKEEEAAYGSHNTDPEKVKYVLAQLNLFIETQKKSPELFDLIRHILSERDSVLDAAYSAYKKGGITFKEALRVAIAQCEFKSDTGSNVP